MRRLSLGNLCLSSFLFIFVQACSPTLGYTYRGKTVITERLTKSIIPQEKSLLFKTRIQVYNKRYSGLILLKQTDKTTAHLTFVTEIGMKMFDFEIKDTSFKLVYIFEPLNKPNIVRLLSADMKLILLKDLLNQEAGIYTKRNKNVFKTAGQRSTYYQTDTTLRLVEKTWTKGQVFTKTKVAYLYNDSLEAQRISLKHSGLIRVKIEMNGIAGASKTN